VRKKLEKLTVVMAARERRRFIRVLHARLRDPDDHQGALPRRSVDPVAGRQKRRERHQQRQLIDI
jgi:hypothetical protein